MGSSSHDGKQCELVVSVEYIGQYTYSFLMEYRVDCVLRGGWRDDAESIPGVESSMNLHKTFSVTGSAQ